MAVPKKRVSRGRRDRRRYNPNNRMKLDPQNKCPECSKYVRPHTVCSCGFYKGKSVLEVRASAQS
jgi:ribosomal protein L32